MPAVGRLIDTVNIAKSGRKMSTVFKKVVHHLIEQYFYIFSPIVQASIIYAVFVILLRLRDFPNFNLAIWTFIIFSIMSPIFNLVLPHWKLNTALFILSWVLLYLALNITFSVVYPAAPGVLNFSIPMLAGGIFLPLTVLLRFIWFRGMTEVDVSDNNPR